MKKTEAKSSGRRSGGLSSWGNLVVDVFKSKATVIGALPTLVLGAAFISAMVGAIEDHNQLQDQLTRLSGEATAQVEKVWWRLEVDTETLTKDGASNWGAYTRPTLCVRLGNVHHNLLMMPCPRCHRRTEPGASGFWPATLPKGCAVRDRSFSPRLSVGGQILWLEKLSRPFSDSIRTVVHTTTASTALRCFS